MNILFWILISAFCTGGEILLIKNIHIKQEDGGENGDCSKTGPFKIYTNNRTVLYIVELSVNCLSAFSLILLEYDWYQILCVLIFLPFLWFIAEYDYKYYIIPNKLILILLLFRVSVFAVQISLNPSEAVYFLTSMIFPGLALFIAGFLCRLASGGSFGMGDVKLLGIYGIYMGVDLTWSCMFYSLIIIFIYALWLLWQKKATKKTEIPFAPSVLMGTIIGVLL